MDWILINNRNCLYVFFFLEISSGNKDIKRYSPSSSVTSTWELQFISGVVSCFIAKRQDKRPWNEQKKTRFFFLNFAHRVFLLLLLLLLCWKRRKNTKSFSYSMTGFKKERIKLMKKLLFPFVSPLEDFEWGWVDSTASDRVTSHAHQNPAHNKQLNSFLSVDERGAGDLVCCISDILDMHIILLLLLLTIFIP